MTGRDNIVNQRIIAEIKNTLQAPQVLLEMMKDQNVSRDNIPMEFIEESLNAIKESVVLLNRLAKWGEG